MTEIEDNIKNVKDYYDTSTKWYDWFYYDKESLGLHYGFWESKKDSKKDALTNQYKIIKDLLKPQKDELILDAGCGVGGASIWLAEHTEAKYMGITLSEEQVRFAQKYIKRRRVEKRVKVQVGNYLDTKFPDKYFDKVFGIESMCYAYPKPLSLYKEIYRVLKPGGKFVISDGVYLRKPKNDSERKISIDYCNGFKLVDMITPTEIMKDLKEAGFRDIKTIDKTKEIKKSIDYIDSRSKLVKPLRFLRYFNLVSQTEVENLLATLNQKNMYETGLFGYAVFASEK